jgi:transposase-like protein
MQGNTPVSDPEIRRLYIDEGLHLKAIGKMVGLSGTGVQLRLKRMGIPRRPRGGVVGRFKLTESQMQQVVTLYDSGCSSREIERRFPISNVTVLDIVRRAGHQVRPADTKIDFPPEIADQYNAGATIQEIAEQCGQVYATTRLELLRLGVVLREKAPLGNTRAKEWHAKVNAKIAELERVAAQSGRASAVGRKPDTGTFEDIQKLRASGIKEWDKIATILNKRIIKGEINHRSADAYRKIYERNMKKQA